MTLPDYLLNPTTSLPYEINTDLMALNKLKLRNNLFFNRPSLNNHFNYKGRYKTINRTKTVIKCIKYDIRVIQREVSTRNRLSFRMYNRRTSEILQTTKEPSLLKLIIL